jgi:hypothetical protein
MPFRYTSLPYLELARRLEVACQWLTELGIAYSHTRVGKYRKILEHLAHRQIAGTLQSISDSYTEDECNNALFEVQQILDIYDGLSGTECQGLAGRLKETVRGHEFYVLANESRSGRDISFELLVAAKYAPEKGRMTFDHGADMAMTLANGAPFYIECKRLKSPDKIESRIKEGLKQLEQRYDQSASPDRARGMLALSIDKIIDVERKTITALNDEDLSQRMANHVFGFIRAYQRYWIAHQRSRTLAVMMILEMPSHVVSRAQYCNSREMHLVFNESISKIESDWLKRVYSPYNP